jgi:L-fucose dehydrogenase
MNLQGKVALVTGAAKGIGKGCALILGQQGADVVVADVDESAGMATAAEIRNLGLKCVFTACDVSRLEQVEALIASVVESFGRLDVLINNAGYHISKDVEHTSEQEWDYMLATNLKSVFLCSKYAIPHLKKTRGTIINMSSMVGLVGQSNAAAYAASKGGIVALSKGMAIDLAGDGIRVNCICPGWVQTPLVEDWFAQQSDPSAARKYVFDMHPVGRISTVEEIGRVALFLCSEEASFITGVALPVDGGVTLGY